MEKNKVEKVYDQIHAPESLKQKKFDESNTKYFDLHGNEIPKSKAQKLGIYVVKIPGVKAYLKKMKN